MPISTSQVFEYLDTHPASQYPDDFSSLLEMLHSIYVESNDISTEKIHSYFQKIDKILRKLPSHENDLIFSLTCSLCQEYEMTAFSHGISVGMHLMTELNALP